MLTNEKYLLPSCDYRIPKAFDSFVKEKLSPAIKCDIPFVTEEQIEKALKAVDPNKAVDADQISARFVQMSVTVLSRHLSYIVNTSIRTDMFPII